MGATQSKVIPIHIRAGEEWVSARKAKRKWKKNFTLLSLLCGSTTRPTSPVTKKIPSCRTPPLYEHPYMATESDIETISLTSIPSSPMTVSDPPHSDSGMPRLNPRRRIILPPLPDPGWSNPTPNHYKSREKKDKGNQKSLKVEGSEFNVKHSKTSVKKNPMTVGDHCLTPDSEHNAELCTVQSNGPGMPNVCNHQQLNLRRRIILPPLPDPGCSNPTPNHPKNKKNKNKGKQKALKAEDSESTVKHCKTAVKKNQATKLREDEAAAAGPPSMRIPTPWPGKMRTPITKQREAKPKRHSAAIHSQDIAARNSRPTITINASNSSSLLPEAIMDEIHSCIAGQQHQYPYPPQDRPLLPLRDSFDSLDSYTQLDILAGPNVDASSEEDDDSISQSPTVSGTVSNIPARPKASYGTVTLQRKEGCFSSSPRAKSPIKIRRSNNMTEAQVRRNQMVIEEVQKEPKRNRLVTAINRLRGITNRTRVSETSDTAEANTSAAVAGTSSEVQVIEISGETEVQVIEISGETEVAGTSAQTDVAEPRCAHRLVICPMDQQPHPFSAGFEGWHYELR